MSRAHLTISGRVQGVTFRANTRRKARQLGVKGWVRNTKDGKVKAVVEGEKDKIEELIDWCRQGPRLAEVQNIEVDWEQEQEEFDNFEIKY